MGQHECDVVVIGAGPGGYVAAIRLAQLGFKVAVVEKRKTFGGTCLNVGCIPSKALLYSSEHVAFINKQAASHGIEIKGVSLDFSQMMKRKEEVVSSLVTGVAGLLKRNKVETFHGTATFSSPFAIDVSHAEHKERITAKQFILATGSDSLELPFLSFDEKKVLSSTGVLSLKKIPKKMLVIGAGVIGVELASVYARLGSEVDIIEMLPMICPAMDKDISKHLLQALKKQGMSFHLQAKVQKAERDAAGVSLEVDTPEGTTVMRGDVVLVAIGRRPFTDGLGLENANVQIDSKGFVPVDGNFATSQPNIYAIGDMIEGPMLAHRASEEGVAVAEIIAGLKTHINYAAIPNVIYTHPEAAAVGLTEEEAKQFGFDVFIGTYSFRGNARARCQGDLDGIVKVIGETSSGRLLGLHIIGPTAAEMIGEGVLALEAKMTVETLGQASHAHPSFSEAIKEAALNALGRAIHA